MTDRPVYGLVLAGGESRRMGTDKALLLNHGESQLARAVRVLGSVTERVFVSTRDEQSREEERAKFEQIIDRYSSMGPIAGVLSAMDTYPGVDWLVVACDLPNISSEMMSALLSGRGRGNPFVAYRSVHNGLPEPLCSIYCEGSEAILRRSVEEGIRCPRKIMINSDTLLFEQASQDALDNVNTPEDLAGSVLKAKA